MMNALATHPFWFLLALACLTWYSTITLYIAFKGAFDVRTMLRHLRDRHSAGADKPKP